MFHGFHYFCRTTVLIQIGTYLPLLSAAETAKQRKNKTHLSLDDIDFQAEHDPDLVALISEKTPRREINLAELQEKLNVAMQKLSEHHRLVVTLHDVQDLSHEEIAEIMGCNIGTVRSRLFYARQQLQAYLSDYLK